MFPSTVRIGCFFHHKKALPSTAALCNGVRVFEFNNFEVPGLRKGGTVIDWYGKRKNKANHEWKARAEWW